MSQALGCAGYLRSLLALEPWPRSNALRQFLGIAMPPPPPSSTEAVSPMVLGHRVPMGALAILLSFCEASAALSVYSRVCKSFRAAALHPSVWPSLRLRSGVAERCIDSLCGILMSTCAGLQSLSLDLTFQQADLGIALPAELVLRQLSSLELTLGDPEANTFACDLLGCLDSPGLIDLKLCGVLTSQLLHALQMALSATLRSLSLTAAPERNSSSEVILDQDSRAMRYWTDATIQRILNSLPSLQQLRVRSSPMMSDQTLHELLAPHLFMIASTVSSRQQRQGSIQNIPKVGIADENNFEQCICAMFRRAAQF
eukprot:Skav233922  [mRNA]  locus=scaffold435:700580:705660:+ [translate_table: standard]